MIYALIDNQINIEAMIVMIITAGIIYVILTPRKAIFETINIIAQSTIIYFVDILHGYRVEISNENYILQVEIALMMFVTLYAMYFFLKNVEDIIKPKKRGKRMKR